MPLVPHIQTSFTTGEMSPRALGRSDLKRYPAGLAVCENFIIQKQGNLARRPGTRYVAEVKDSSKLTILVPFRVSTVANYVIELGHQYARFYVDRGQLLKPNGNPAELTTPWTESDLRELKFFQSADVMYVCHPDYQPREIRRTNATRFGITTKDFNNGPYFDRNITGTFLTSSALTGSTTLTADEGTGTIQVTGINDGRGFLQGDVGRLIRWQEAAATGLVTWLTITAVPSETSITNITQANPAVVTATGHGLSNGQIVYIKDVGGMEELNDRAFVVAGVSGATFQLTGEDSSSYAAYTSGGTCQRSDTCTADVSGPDISSGQADRRSWSLGSWSDTTGWPRTGCFHQGRIWFGGTTSQPQGVWSSMSGNYDDFSPTDVGSTTNPGGLVEDDHAITRTIDANQVHNIYHLHSHAKGLLIMTDGGEWMGGTTGGPFEPATPDNFGILQQSAYGCKPNVRTHQAGNALLFPQFSGRKLREFIYQFEDDQFIAFDLTELAEHIGGDGWVDSAYQQEPDPTLWMVREEGQLCSMVYDRENKVFGWSRHIIGGSFKGGDAQVASVACVRDDPYDLVWLIVKRTVNGSTVRYVEYIGDLFDASDNNYEAFYVDSGLASVDKPEIISAITKANPGVVTVDITGALAYGNGTSVVIRDVEGMTELNGNTYTVANSTFISGTTYTFELSGTDTSAYGTYTKGGTVRNLISNLSGLSHLEGETVKVAGDGSAQGDETVSSGSITLDTAASIVYVGLENSAKIVTAPMVPSNFGFDPRTSTIRAARAWLTMYRSYGGSLGQYGQDIDDLEYQSGDLTDGLMTGVIEHGISGADALQFQLELRADSIYPMTLLQIGVEAHASGPS